MVKRFMAIHTPGNPICMPQGIRVFHTLREINQWRLENNIDPGNIEVLELSGSPVPSIYWVNEY